MSLPISLSYYASGIKIEEASTWAGLGWTLNAGGVISRTIRGNRADVPIGSGSTSFPLPIPNTPSKTDYDNIVNWADGADTEYDIFYYNFNGHTGSFYFKRNIPILKKYDDIKIEYTLNSTSSNINGFTITVKDGTRYYFGVNYAGDTQFMQITEWYLKKIVNSNSTDTINLSYVSSSNSTVVPPRNSKYYSFYGYSTSPNAIYNTPGYNYEDRYTGDILSNIYTSNHDSLVFITKKRPLDNKYPYDCPAQALDSIKMYNAKKEKVKSFKFNTNFIETTKPYSLQIVGSGYPYVGFSDVINYRIYLDGVTELGLNGEKITHRFEYFGRTTDGRDSLPNSLSFAQDMGGYYNGNDDNTSLIPTFDDYLNPFGEIDANPCIDYRYPYDKVTIPGSNRSTNFNYMKMGTIKAIEYPTGGVVKFTFSQKMNPVTNEPFWGLNIDKIETFDKEANLLKRKKYQYSNATLGHNIPSNVSYTYYNLDKYDLSFYPVCNCINNGCDDYGKWKTTIELSPGPKEDLGLFEGPMVGYGKVEEIEEGNGSTIYEYSNDDGYIEVLASPIEVISYGVADISQTSYSVHHSTLNIGLFWPLGPFPDNSWKRGVLLNKSVYSNNGGLLQNTSYDYSFIELEKLPAIKVYTYRKDFQYFYYQYNYISSWIRLNGITETINGVATTRSFEYNSSNHKQKTREVIRQSDKINKIIDYKYPDDFNFLEPYKKMTEQYFISPIIESIEKKDGSTTQSTKTNYAYFQNNKIIAPSYVETQRGGNLYETRLRYYDYDNKGNVLCVSKENDIKTTYLWGYNQSYPVAKIDNANQNEIFFTSFDDCMPVIDGWAASTSIDASHARTGKYSLKSTNNSNSFIYHFFPKLTINNTTDKKYRYSCWVYSSGPQANLYLFWKDNTSDDWYAPNWDAVHQTTSETNKWVLLEGEVTVPASAKQIYLRADNMSAGTVWFDDFRLYPATANMTSYTYAPLIGISSSTDDNNITTYYEYDSFGRLKDIKDKDQKILKHYEYHYQNQ